MPFLKSQCPLTSLLFDIRGGSSQAYISKRREHESPAVMKLFPSNDDGISNSMFALGNQSNVKRSVVMCVRRCNLKKQNTFWPSGLCLYESLRMFAHIHLLYRSCFYNQTSISVTVIFVIYLFAEYDFVSGRLRFGSLANACVTSVVRISTDRGVEN